MPSADLSRGTAIPLRFATNGSIGSPSPSGTMPGRRPTVATVRRRTANRVGPGEAVVESAGPTYAVNEGSEEALTYATYVVPEGTPRAPMFTDPPPCATGDDEDDDDDDHGKGKDDDDDDHPKGKEDDD